MLPEAPVTTSCPLCMVNKAKVGIGVPGRQWKNAKPGANQCRK